MSTPVYDVAILGSGMAGSMLSMVLARNGVKVLLIDAGIHPRFAVGESTIPYTSALIKIIAERYQVPELHALENFKGIVEKVSQMCGRKRNFGFVYHVEGQPHDPSQINEIVLPNVEQRMETHLFRQDIDAHLFHLAIKYGVETRTATKIIDIDIDAADGVRLKSEQGEEFRAKYLVDGSGYRSPVAQKFGLREQPTRARHHSRGMFTHMVGVTPFDDAAAAQGHTQPSAWHHGTLHHVFDGGWLWVIPFDNHDRSRNPLCSVGLTLDERVFPSNGLPPQQEFDSFLARFPEIAEQFRDAKTVRPWVSTGDRMQYSSSSTVGDRYCLTAHAAGFIDALYSRGLSNTVEVVNALAALLIERHGTTIGRPSASPTSTVSSRGCSRSTTTWSTAPSSASGTTICGTRSSGCGSRPTTCRGRSWNAPMPPTWRPGTSRSCATWTTGRPQRFRTRSAVASAAW